MKKRDVFIGFLCIIIGAASLLDTFLGIQPFSISTLWPLFILIPGLSMELAFIKSGKDAAVLVPGGLLTTLGLLFLFETFTGWRFSAYTWPVYPLSLAIGLYQFYIFGGKPKPVLVIAFILSAVSIISFVSILLHSLFAWLNRKFLLSILIIALGVILACRGFSKKEDKTKTGTA